MIYVVCCNDRFAGIPPAFSTNNGVAASLMSHSDFSIQNYSTLVTWLFTHLEKQQG